MLRHNRPHRSGGCAVKKKRFSTEQIAAVLHQAEQGIPVVELCRQVGKLKRLVADLSLDKVVLQDVLQKKF